MDGRIERGVGAVNQRGDVVVFVPSSSWRAFDEFAVFGDVVWLGAPDGEGHASRQGPLTVEAARRTGVVYAQEIRDDGSAGEMLVTEARRGR